MSECQNLEVARALMMFSGEQWRRIISNSSGELNVLDDDELDMTDERFLLRGQHRNCRPSYVLRHRRIFVNLARINVFDA